MNKKHIIPFLLSCVLGIHSLFAQEAVDSLADKKYTPYELLSSYYGKQFQPFKKSNIYLGISFSVENKDIQNVDYLVKQVVDGKKNNFNIKLKGGYYIGDYTMLGLNVDYTQKQFSGKVLQNSDTVTSNVISRGFSVTPTLRPSFPLLANNRLSFFTEIGLTYGLSTSLDRTIQNVDEINRSFEKIHTFSIGISPGITFFAMENFAFEVGLNVLGYTMEISDRTRNNTEHSRVVRNNVDFKLNLLSLDMGLSYYFIAGKNKAK